MFIVSSKSIVAGKQIYLPYHNTWLPAERAEDAGWIWLGNKFTIIAYKSPGRSGWCEKSLPKFHEGDPEQKAKSVVLTSVKILFIHGWASSMSQCRLNDWLNMVIILQSCWHWTDVCFLLCLDGTCIFHRVATNHDQLNDNKFGNDSFCHTTWQAAWLVIRNHSTEIVINSTQLAGWSNYIL